MTKFIDLFNKIARYNRFGSSLLLNERGRWIDYAEARAIAQGADDDVAKLNDDLRVIYEVNKDLLRTSEAMSNELARYAVAIKTERDELRRQCDENEKLRRQREVGFAEFRKEVAARYAAQDELRAARTQLAEANAEGDKLRAEVTTLGHSWLATRVTLGRLRMRLQRALEDRK